MKTTYDDEMFDEAIEALQPNVTILNNDETNKIVNLFQKKATIYTGGSRIDWKKITTSVKVSSSSEIINSLNKLIKKPDLNVYVFWNDASLPVIKTNLESIVKAYDDVVSVGFETWMYNPDQGYVVENYYLGEIHIGII